MRRAATHATMGLRAILVTACVAAGLADVEEASSRSLTLNGPEATHLGHQVTFVGRLSPAEHRALVGIYLGSSVIAWTRTSDTGFFVARPRLFTAGSYRARLPGAVSPPFHVRIVRRTLDRGDRGAGVGALVKRLSELGYAVANESTQRFDGAVRQSVWAFQKAQGIEVDGIVGPVTRARLRDPNPITPLVASPPDHIEVDKQRQLLLVVRKGRVARIVNASTAGIPGYHTPEGRFRVFRRVEGIDQSPLGRLWNPLYFHRGYAIHGSTTVPPEPASHGCIRVPLWEAERLFDAVPNGRVVVVY
jgi:N-acetylmuramoyl-L-alanine amidase